MNPVEPLDSTMDQSWLEAGNSQIALCSPFNIGRSLKCRFVINNDTASREHSLLQFNEVERRWLLIDLGSTNGTYLNGQRIICPVPLHDGDVIRICDQTLVFRESSQTVVAEEAPDSNTDDRTILAITRLPCWLLIADVKQSTQLIQQLSHEEWSAKLRTWSHECEEIVHGNGGLINEYMGDGLLAFWRDGADLPSCMARVLARFNSLESASGMAFRVICHYGMLSFGAGMSSGREKLAGQELNFVFKIEKPAGLTGHKINLTQAAVVRLGTEMRAVEVGEFDISGFAGRHKLFTLGR